MAHFIRPDSQKRDAETLPNETLPILKCTYSFERSLNEEKMFSFKKKLIIMSIFRVFETYNLLLNIPYFLI